MQNQEGGNFKKTFITLSASRLPDADAGRIEGVGLSVDHLGTGHRIAGGRILIIPAAIIL